MNCPHCGKLIGPQTELKPTENDISRFWKHVRKSDGCWICDLVPSGTYARIYSCNKLWLAHVFSYVIHKGPVPSGMKVCHTCDTPRCVRPDHLEAKSHSENMRDMVARKRNKPLLGSLNNLAKLTDEQVLIVLNGAEPTRTLANRFGVSFQSIWRIRKGLSRKHLN